MLVPASGSAAVVPPRPRVQLNPELCLGFLADVNSRSARVLLLLVVPGHLIFLYTINSLQGGHTTLTLIFIVFYMMAALLQVSGGPSGIRGHCGVTCAGACPAVQW